MTRPSLESLIYFLVIVLCIAVVVLVLASTSQFSGITPVYRAF